MRHRRSRGAGPRPIATCRLRSCGTQTSATIKSSSPPTSSFPPSLLTCSRNLLCLSFQSFLSLFPSSISRSFVPSPPCLPPCPERPLRRPPRTPQPTPTLFDGFLYPSSPLFATYVHTSAMGVGLTSLGHLWTGRRRPHNHYVIGDPADTTPIAFSARHRRPQAPNGGGLRAIGRSRGGAAGHNAARFAGQRLRGGPPLGCSKTRHRRPQMRAIEQSRGDLGTMPSWHAGCRPRWGTASHRAGHGRAAWHYATRHH